MFVACNKRNIIAAVSEKPFQLAGYTVHEVADLLLSKSEWHKLIGTKLKTKDKHTNDLKVAFVCNWNDFCGISTYTKFLVDAMRPKVQEIRIFSEIVNELSEPDGPEVSRCWERGKSMLPMLEELHAWGPDFIIIQHEFGIFPKATYFLQMLQSIENIPYVVTMHSVYEHLDKTVCHAAAKNIVVHSNEGEKTLRRTGNSSKIFVIPHGCVQFPEDSTSELWNIFQTPYAMFQFGFGFFYKGVDRVLDAVRHLKSSDPKFQDIFYCYLCSENDHTSFVHTQYYDFLMDKIKELNIEDNAVIIKKFQSEKVINNYLRTAKLALFPYVGDPRNMVYGASGAIRVAMANGIPVIASNCHQFDDLEGVVPRPGDYLSLAQEIDRVFSSDSYKGELLAKSKKYIEENTWDISADRYINLYYHIV
jgi:glycosyltransferase involved in cell wall biosynthesis